MKIAKKSLSIFLSLLMIFSVCSVGLTGIVASAAPGDSKYTHTQVISAVNAATAGGFDISSSGNTWNYTGDNGVILNAANLIFDYAIKTYRVSGDKSDFNNATAIYNAFVTEFESEFTNAAAAKMLIKNILDPNGDNAYSYSNKVQGTKYSYSDESSSKGGTGTDIADQLADSYFSSSVKNNLTKTSYVQLDVNEYLMTFDTIDDIPASFETSLKFTYAHVLGKEAILTETEESGCFGSKSYDGSATPYSWNYFKSKPVRSATKNTTAKKQLLAYEKFFNDELLATTREAMLTMPLDRIENLYSTAFNYYNVMVKDFSPAVINHFNLGYEKITAFVNDVSFAYRALAGIHNIDVLNTYIGSEYNEDDYGSMLELYTKVNAAYDFVYSMDTDVIDYIVNEAGYADNYDSALAIKSAAESYINTLFEIMTEQRLEETVDSVVDTYTEYIGQLDKEDIETPTDAEVIGLVQKVEGFDSVLGLYTGKTYYRNYWSEAYEAEWNNFKAKLNEVAEVRDLKLDFETYYTYFLPIIFTNQVADLTNDEAVDLHKNMQTQLAALRQSYSDVAAQWGYTIADKIFTIEYEGSDYLLQTLIDSVKSTGLEAVKTVITVRCQEMLDTVYAYRSLSEVNYENFADVKSALAHFDYDMYDYANSLGWIIGDYTSKYSEVQVLLDKYHTFSTSDGKALFNENFTYADENGIYATRYAGNQVISDGEGGEIQIGFPSDLARDGAEDNYYVIEDILLDTIVRIDSFITSRDFGALVGFVDEEEEAIGLKTYLMNMLDTMLFTDDMMNQLVGMIFPMITDLLETELVGAISGMDGGGLDANGVPYIDIGEVAGTSAISGSLSLYFDKAKAPAHGQGDQNEFPKVFADLGLYIYPSTLADSLAISNPAVYGIESDIYKALKAAGRDWKVLVNEEEDLVLDFAWGVYDKDSFLDTIACIFDALLPLLQAALSTADFEGEASNAAIAYSAKVTAIGFLSTDAWIRGGLALKIPALNVFNKHIIPLFETLGIENVPNLPGECSSDEIVNALLGTLLTFVEDLLNAPLSTLLELLPNLVYFISMDSVQEIINDLIISLELTIAEVEVIHTNSFIGSILDAIDGALAGKISFPIDLNLADELDLMDLLGFEISNFNEILNFALSALGADLSLPPIKQQEIIFCSDWATNAAGRVDLQANKGDIMYWFLNYVITALGQEGFFDSIMALINGAGEEGAETAAEDEEGGIAISDEMLNSILNRIIYSVTNNQDGALAAIVELLNPVEYDLQEMNWIEGVWDYNGIEGANQMSVVYLNYGNDWNRDKAEYLVDNVDSLIETILELTGSDIESLGAYLGDMINGLFTNDNITALVKMLGGLGDSASAVIEDILNKQIGVNLESWFIAFGYLFPAETWKEDAEIIEPDSRYYVNNFGVEGVANEDGTISWFFNKMPLVDGDGYTFINILTRLLGEASILVEFLFAGADVSAFNDLLTIKGYESFGVSLGLLLDMLGVEGVPTQADFNADAMGSLNTTLHALLDWLNALLASETMIRDLVEILPDLFYFIESNGLSTLLHNLLMPILVLVDTVRPLIDVDVNGVLSLLISDFINYGEINLDVLLQYIFDGIYVNDDLEYKYYSVDINNLTVTEIMKIVDGYLGTNLYESGLVQIGIKGLCSGVVADGAVYRPTVDAADAMTVIVTAFLDCLSYETATGETNGDVLFGFIAEMTGNEQLVDMYGIIADVIAGIEYEYGEPDWGYMFESSDKFSLILPEQSIVYLGYTTDWTKEAADNVYAALDDVLALVLPSILEENETIGTLLNGLLEDNVYSDEILNTLVELIVNALASLDASLFELVDVVVDTDIASWFTMCTLDETSGKYICTKDWGIDTAENKKDVFISALKEVLSPANSLLSWLFFGDEYAFFTGSETDANGDYVFNDIITLNGGEGYAYGLAPIFEALGCTLAPASDFYDAATDTYNAGNAVEALLNSLFALVDEISAAPVKGIINLLPNIIYFLNAGGIKASVNNLLAPVNAIIAKLAPVVGDVSIGGLIADAIGFDICNITTETLLGIAADAGFVLSPEMVEIISELYVGKLAEFTSVNGRKAYRLDVEGYEGDVLTIVLSIALDAFNLNADIFSDILGEETYYAVYNLIKGASSAFVYRDMNWAYMYSGEDAATQLYNNNLPDRTGDAYQIYTQYQNNWNKATADYLDIVLDTLVKDITKAARSDGSSLGKLIDDAVTNGLYQDDILNSLIEMVVELLVDYEDIIRNAGVLLGAEGLAKWFDEYCEITTDENGETVVNCVKDWGIDSAATNAEKRTAFVEGFVDALQPAYRLLAWLLFGEDYTFLNGTTNSELITIKGGEGYNEALVPLLEGLTCTMNYSGTASGIKPASAFYVDGELDMEQAVRDVFTAITDLLAEICGDIDGEGSIGIMLDKLPNIIYFINADGLKVVVNNLLQPVNFILDALKPMGVNVDFATLIDGVDITNLDFYGVFNLLEDLLGLYFPDYTQDFLATFYIGQVVPFESANGKLAYHMTYSDAEPRRDMITVLISFVLDAFVDERNDDRLKDWLGEDVYNGIVAVLGIQGVKAMQEFSWILTEYADTDKEFSGLDSSVEFDAAYNKIWTEDKAEYIADNLTDFVTDILCLLGLQINGTKITSLDILLDSLLTGELYTQATADALLNVLRSLPELFGEYSEIGKKAIAILDNALGTSIGSWETMTVTVVDGDRESFIAALEQMLAPVVPVLDLLLCGENIELFYSIDGTGRDALTIYGSEGYAYGIIPLFEALGCTMMTPAEFKALDDEDKIGAILSALLDRVDTILADPVNEIFELLPGVIYFINSNGLDTAVKNIINSVDTVLMALEPLLGAPDLMTLLGVDLATYDFEYIMNLAVDAIEDSSGIDTTNVLVDFVAELTTGKVVSYTSANGETYYTMKYAGDWQKSDMVTIVLRLLIDFLAEGNNADAVIGLIANNTESEDATNSASTLIKFILTALATEPVTSGAMATLYYIFYGIHTGIDALDREYHEFNNTWKFVLNFFEHFGDPVTSTGVKVLRNILDKYFDGIFDSDGLASDGVMTFWDKIVEFFRKIGDFFRRLFGMA